MSFTHCPLENGENDTYSGDDRFNNDSRFVFVVASDKQGHYGNEYHVRVKNTDGSPVSLGTVDFSISEFLDYHIENNDYTYVIRDIPEEMKMYKYKGDAIDCFTRARLQQCYYPSWW